MYTIQRIFNGVPFGMNRVKYIQVMKSEINTKGTHKQNEMSIRIFRKWATREEKI